MANVTFLKVQVGDDGPIHLFEGRPAWALANLVRAGKTGCTAIDHPGPRWSDYVFKLRKAGLVIETISEEHFGPYHGFHGRYVLHTPLQVLSEGRG